MPFGTLKTREDEKCRTAEYFCFFKLPFPQLHKIQPQTVRKLQSWRLPFCANTDSLVERTFWPGRIYTLASWIG